MKQRGYVYCNLIVSSETISADEISRLLGTARYIQQKGSLMGNGKTYFEISSWIKCFNEYDGDAFDDALLEVKRFCEQSEGDLKYLKMQDELINLSLELVFRMGDYHFGGILKREYTEFFNSNNISICLSIYPNCSAPS